MSGRQLPEGWEQTDWAQVSTLRYGRALERQVDDSGSTEIFGTNGPIGWAAVKPLGHGPKVIVGRKGAYRGIHLARSDFWVIDTAFWLETSDRVDARWAYYSLKLADINGLDAGSAIPSTTRAGFGSLSLELPPVGQQRAIAEVLGALDDKIAANAAVVTAAHAFAIAVASRTTSVVPVGAVATHVRTQISPTAMVGELVDHYSLPAFDARKGPDVQAPTEIKSGKFLVAAPSVLISKLNPRFPRVWEIPVIGGRQTLASTEFVVLEPHTISTSLLWALVAQPSVSASLESQVAGTSGSHQRVKPEAVLGALVGDPETLSSGDRRLVESTTARAHGVELETRHLAATRDALLPALMSGRLTVRGAEHVVAGAT